MTLGTVSSHCKSSSKAFHIFWNETFCDIFSTRTFFIWRRPLSDIIQQLSYYVFSQVIFFDEWMFTWLWCLRSMHIFDQYFLKAIEDFSNVYIASFGFSKVIQILDCVSGFHNFLFLMFGWGYVNKKEFYFSSSKVAGFVKELQCYAKKWRKQFWKVTLKLSTSNFLG